MILKNINLEIRYREFMTIAGENGAGKSSLLQLMTGLLKPTNEEIHKEEKIKELTLLLLYLSSWDEKESFGTLKRSWKGYPFDILDELTNQEFIYDDFSYYEKLKKLYQSDEWLIILEKILAHFENDPYEESTYLNILLEEKLKSI